MFLNVRSCSKNNNCLVFFQNKIVSFCGECGSLLPVMGQMLFKIFYILVRRRSFDNMYWTVKELWKSTDNKERKEGLQSLANQAKLFSIAFFACCFSNNISFATTAIIDWVESYSHENDSDFIRHIPYAGWSVIVLTIYSILCT